MRVFMSDDDNSCRSDSAPDSRSGNQTIRADGLLELPSPFIVENGVIRLIEPHDAPQEALYERLLDGGYDKPFILDDGNIRYLYFSLRYIQSAMRIDDPDVLDLRYTQKMMGFLLFNPNPQDIVLVGLGGGSIVKFCHRQLPLATITAVEIDPDVISFRDEFCIPGDDDRFRIVCADGARFVAEHGGGIDVLLVDAYNKIGVADSLAKHSFVEDAQRSLAPRGVLVVNLAGGEADYASIVSDIIDVFDHRVLAVSVQGGGNHILFAFKDRAFPPQWRRLSSDAKDLRNQFGLEFPTFSRKLEQSAKAKLAWRLSLSASASSHLSQDRRSAARHRWPRSGAGLLERE